MPPNLFLRRRKCVSRAFSPAASYLSLPLLFFLFFFFLLPSLGSRVQSSSSSIPRWPCSVKVVLIYLRDDATGEIRAETEKDGGREREREKGDSLGRKYGDEFGLMLLEVE